MNDKVMVTSMVGGTISAASLEHRVWNKKGQKLPVSKDVLREAIYEPGIEYMFKKGILYIDDMEMKIELGLEAPGTTAPTEVLPVDDKYLNRVLRLMPISEMKAAIDKMSIVQKQELVDYTSKQNDIQLDRLAIVSEKCNVDILKTIELNRQKEV